MYYIVEPLCHGNGGWHGQTTLATFKKLPEALKWKPDNTYILSHCPYSGRILNEPRLCRTDNPNDAIYIYDMNDYMWEKA